MDVWKVVYYFSPLIYFVITYLAKCTKGMSYFLSFMFFNGNIKPHPLNPMKLV